MTLDTNRCLRERDLRMASQPKKTEEARVPHYAHASTSSKEKKEEKKIPHRGRKRLLVTK